MAGTWRDATRRCVGRCSYGWEGYDVALHADDGRMTLISFHQGPTIETAISTFRWRGPEGGCKKTKTREGELRALSITRARSAGESTWGTSGESGLR